MHCKLGRYNVLAVFILLFFKSVDGKDPNCSNDDSVESFREEFTGRKGEAFQVVNTDTERESLQTDAKYQALLERILSIEKQLQTCQHNNGAMEERIRKLEDNTFDSKRGLNLRVRATTQVAFHARLKNDLTSIGTNQPIVFNDVTLNNGNAYNSGDGIFITPVAGIYVFALSVMVVREHHISITLKSTDGVIGVIYVDDGQFTFNSASNVFLARLNKGVHVWARKEGANGNFLHGGYSTISGFLFSVVSKDPNCSDDDTVESFKDEFIGRKGNAFQVINTDPEMEDVQTDAKHKALLERILSIEKQPVNITTPPWKKGFVK
ncbi:heavy metal-binding protein HIP-like [Mytilus trossulus]|uniref:heavy metal-binding protein HIP-like n=1 Tax=Mytilus trossulus TaxID=6551 RepID=UPI003004B98C